MMCRAAVRVAISMVLHMKSAVGIPAGLSLEHDIQHKHMRTMLTVLFTPGGMHGILCVRAVIQPDWDSQFKR